MENGKAVKAGKDEVGYKAVRRGMVEEIERVFVWMDLVAFHFKNSGGEDPRRKIVVEDSNHAGILAADGSVGLGSDGLRFLATPRTLYLDSRASMVQIGR